MIIGVPCSKLQDWLNEREYHIATDEGEAVGIAAGHYLATKKPATVFLQSDGFPNALNPLTTLVIPYGIKVNWVISIRDKGPQHEVMGDTIEHLIELYGLKRTGNIKIIR